MKILILCLVLLIQGCSSPSESLTRIQNLSIAIPSISNGTNSIQGLELEVQGLSNLEHLSQIVFFIFGNEDCRTEAQFFHPVEDEKGRQIAKLDLLGIQSCIGDLQKNISLNLQLKFSHDIEWQMNTADFVITAISYDVANEKIRFDTLKKQEYKSDTGVLSLPMPFTGEERDFVYYPNYTVKFSPLDKVNNFNASFGISGGVQSSNENEWNFSYDFYDYIGDQWIEFSDDIPASAKITKCSITSRLTGVIFNCPW